MTCEDCLFGLKQQLYDLGSIFKVLPPEMLTKIFAYYSQGDLDWEVAVLLSQEGVDLLAPILINRGTNRPNKAEGKPELHHCTQIVFVGHFYLELEGEKLFIIRLFRQLLLLLLRL